MNKIKFFSIVLLFPLLSFSLFSKEEFSLEKYEIKDEKMLQKIKLDSLQTDIYDLQEKLTKNQSNIDYLSQRISDLQVDLNLLKRTEIYFNCKELSKGFQQINTNSGILFVDVKEVTPYLNGCKVSLVIGNPNLITYVNPEINLTWNTSILKYFKAIEEKIDVPLWESTLQKKSYCSMKKLLPGVWNEIELDIPNVTLDQLEHCTLSITTGVILLSKDTRNQ